MLTTLPDASVQCCVTSPPYFGLRDYGTASWEGGDAECDHIGPPHRTQAGFNERYFGKAFNDDKQGELREPYRHTCGKCGARRIDQQIGLESTVDCGQRGFMRLRSDLTAAQREYVVRRLLGAGIGSSLDCDKDGKA